MGLRTRRQGAMTMARHHLSLLAPPPTGDVEVPCFQALSSLSPLSPLFSNRDINSCFVLTAYGRDTGAAGDTGDGAMGGDSDCRTAVRNVAHKPYPLRLRITDALRSREGGAQSHASGAPLPALSCPWEYPGLSATQRRVGSFPAKTVLSVHVTIRCVDESTASEVA